MFHHFKSTLMLGMLTAFLAFSGSALAQPFPSKPIRLIVPYPPGGGTDGLARVLAERMSERLGQRVVIENLGGAGGTIGSAATAKAAPDGYTIMMGTLATHSIAPALYPKLSYSVAGDFKPIANFAYLTNYVLAGPSLNVTSVADLIKRAKAEPGKIKFASAGNGSAGHLAIELLRTRTGIDVVHVPYKGGGPALTDLLGGHVDAIIGDPVTMLPHIHSGKLRALAFAGPRRSAALPNVPTTAEAGLPDFYVRIWHGVLAPAGVSPEVAKTLADAVHSATVDPATQSALAKMGAEPADEMLDEFGKLLQAEALKWGEVVRSGNVRLD
ncbi:MAG: tripartite tricarboxylate transporter substrate binding protein [Ramlibacter sp.]